MGAREELGRDDELVRAWAVDQEDLERRFVVRAFLGSLRSVKKRMTDDKSGLNDESSYGMYH